MVLLLRLLDYKQLDLKDSLLCHKSVIDSQIVPPVQNEPAYISREPLKFSDELAVREKYIWEELLLRINIRR